VFGEVRVEPAGPAVPAVPQRLTADPDEVALAAELPGLPVVPQPAVLDGDPLALVGVALLALVGEQSPGVDDQHEAEDDEHYDPATLGDHARVSNASVMGLGSGARGAPMHSYPSAVTVGHMSTRLTDSPVPRLGLGTWQNTDPEQCAESVRTALDMGYSHVDTAELYDNEGPVGEGIRTAETSRESVYLATKVLHPRNVDGEPTRESVRGAVEGCLDRLGVDRVDLLYVHWPVDYDLELVHGTLAACRDDGLVDGVGVSNYEPDHVERALETDPEVVANQVECHPLLSQEPLRESCAEVGVDVVAYAPLAHGNVFEVDVLEGVADRHGVSVPQVTLAWLREKGIAAVPKATSEEHIRDNWESRTLDLDSAEVEAIDGIEREERFFDPDYAPEW
jgi:2,5-diketo-D-gluconate reductase B